MTESEKARPQDARQFAAAMAQEGHGEGHGEDHGDNDYCQDGIENSIRDIQ